jgi:hypothetical protein
MAAHPLAYCPTCKIVFPLVPPQGGTVVFKNSTASCPDGHFARILNAVHQAFEAEVKATLGIHHQAVRRPVLALWEKLRRREIEAEEAQAQAEHTRPGLGLIFNPANFSDPVKKAIVETLIAELGAEAEPEAPVVPQAPHVPQIPQIVVPNPVPAPKTEATRELLKPRRISNRAFQRHLRHQHRLLMNPRHR